MINFPPEINICCNVTNDEKDPYKQRLMQYHKKQIKKTTKNMMNLTNSVHMPLESKRWPNKTSRGVDL